VKTAGSPGSWVELWLFEPRYKTYLDAVGGDRGLGLDLYEWNVAMSAAVLHDLAHLEVALRNVYDRALTAGVPPGGQHWTVSPERFFGPVIKRNRDGSTSDVNHRPRKQIHVAVRTAGPGAPPGKIVAELMFGFWRYLSTSAHEKPLWLPYLRHGFITGTSRPAVDHPVARLHLLRNRVVHNEPLLSTDLIARHSDVLVLASRMSPELRTHLGTTSRWLTVRGQRPT
jgi:hypothetical protein